MARAIALALIMVVQAAAGTPQAPPQGRTPPPAVTAPAPAAPAQTAPGQTAPTSTTPTPPRPSPDLTSAIAMLDHITTLVDQALAAEPSGDLKTAGQVTIARATLDQLRSELTQVKTMLQTVSR
jgi:hypothetical protein